MTRGRNDDPRSAKEQQRAKHEPLRDHTGSPNRASGGDGIIALDPTFRRENSFCRRPQSK
jgi:hypothetical protein